jgi:hypothetical protein
LQRSVAERGHLRERYRRQCCAPDINIED